MNQIKICTAFGMYNHCDDCRHNIENHPEFNGMKNHPAGKYVPIDPVICQLSKPPYVQFEAMLENT